jgi:putative transcriptional regulator
MKSQMGKWSGSRKMKSLQGQYLVAAPYQLDPNFMKTAILVVEHTRRGAFGVVVNGASEESRRFAQCNAGMRSASKVTFFCGGPVTGPLMAIHTRASLGERLLLPGVFFSGKEKNVLALMWQAEQPCKIFMGYAGWGARQLEYEVEQGVWRVVPATPEQIFCDDSELWEHLSRQASWRQLRSVFNLRYIPADPLLN